MKTKIWILASRPKTLLASITPVIVGSAFAFQRTSFSLWVFSCTILFAVLIQIGTNLSNDYFDALKGADTKGRKGPVRVTQAGLISPKEVRAAFFATFLAALLIAIPLALKGGAWVWFLMFASIALGYLYTGGPYPLAYLGLGDIFVLVFFGPVATLGTYYLQTLELNFHVFSLGVGMGLLSTAILTVNNLRDIDEDMKANKKTLAVRFGKTFSRLEYIFCVLLAFAICLSYLPWLYWILIVPMAPLLIRLFKGIFTTYGYQLNDLLSRTAALLVLYTILSVLGS